MEDEKELENKPTPDNVDPNGEEIASLLSVETLAKKDARVAHLIVDVMAGKNVDEAAETYFGTRRRADVDEAEQRGYMRGRNEQIEMLMNEPHQWNARGQKPAQLADAEVLGGMRKSIWD